MSTIIIISSLSSVLNTREACDTKQLLDEVEHDIMTYQNRGLCSASADNTDTRF